MHFVYTFIIPAIVFFGVGYFTHDYHIYRKHSRVSRLVTKFVNGVGRWTTLRV